MDWFGLGGVLVAEEDVESILNAHKKFCDDWKITYPLHSSPMRGGRGNFGWLQSEENQKAFFPELVKYVLSQPITCIACVVDRPGYVARYKEAHKERLWMLCKTAFSILIERSAKYADGQGRKLEVYFEETGKKEDRSIKEYLRDLKKVGHPFNSDSSKGYSPLSTEDYKRIVLGEPRGKTKNVPMIQLADLVLYPIVKQGYDPTYRSYSDLKAAGKLIDCHLKDEEIAFCGIKYSCFDFAKK